jgi:hypothetical protein
VTYKVGERHARYICAAATHLPWASWGCPSLATACSSCPPKWASVAASKVVPPEVRCSAAPSFLLLPLCSFCMLCNKQTALG